MSRIVEYKYKDKTHPGLNLTAYRLREEANIIISKILKKKKIYWEAVSLIDHCVANHSPEDFNWEIHRENGVFISILLGKFKDNRKKHKYDKKNIRICIFGDVITLIDKDILEGIIKSYLSFI